MPAVAISNLRVRYGDVVAVDDISFTADEGEVVAIVGPNGAGKTSTIEAAEGYRPYAGTIEVLGRPPGHPRSRPDVGVMLQTPGLYPSMRAHEAVRLFAAYYDDPLDPDAVIDLVGLRERERASWREMSGGEQQRLSLGLALVGRPRVAFLDEPTAGVDVQGRQVIRQTIRDLARGGACVVVASHELAEVERTADRVVVIDRGKVLADGSPDALRRGGEAAVRFSSRAGLDVDALARHLGAPASEVTAGEYLVDASGTPALIAALTGWLAAEEAELGDLRVGRQRLEDVFDELTGSPEDPA